MSRMSLETKPIHICVPKKFLDDLDRAAAAENIGRSEFIRKHIAPVIVKVNQQVRGEGR